MSTHANEERKYPRLDANVVREAANIQNVEPRRLTRAQMKNSKKIRFDINSLKTRAEEFLNDRGNLHGCSQPELRGSVDRCLVSFPIFNGPPPNSQEPCIVLEQKDTRDPQNGSYGVVFGHPGHKDRVVKVFLSFRVLATYERRGYGFDASIVHAVDRVITVDEEEELLLMKHAFVLGSAPFVDPEPSWCHFKTDVRLVTCDPYFKVVNVMHGGCVRGAAFRKPGLIRTGTTWPCIAMGRAAPWPRAPGERLAIDFCRRILALNLPENPDEKGIHHWDVATRNAMASPDGKCAVVVDFGFGNFVDPGVRRIFTGTTENLGEFVSASLEVTVPRATPDNAPEDATKLATVPNVVRGVEPWHMYYVLAQHNLVIDAASWYILVHKLKRQDNKFKGSLPSEILRANFSRSEEVSVRGTIAKALARMRSDPVVPPRTSARLAGKPVFEVVPQQPPVLAQRPPPAGVRAVQGQPVLLGRRKQVPEAGKWGALVSAARDLKDRFMLRSVIQGIPLNAPAEAEAKAPPVAPKPQAVIEVRAQPVARELRSRVVPAVVGAKAPPVAPKPQAVIEVKAQPVTLRPRGGPSVAPPRAASAVIEARAPPVDPPVVPPRIAPVIDHRTGPVAVDPPPPPAAVYRAPANEPPRKAVARKASERQTPAKMGDKRRRARDPRSEEKEAREKELASRLAVDMARLDLGRPGVFRVPTMTDEKRPSPREDTAMHSLHSNVYPSLDVKRAQFFNPVMGDNPIMEQGSVDGDDAKQDTKQGSEEKAGPVPRPTRSITLGPVISGQDDDPFMDQGTVSDDEQDTKQDDEKKAESPSPPESSDDDDEEEEEEDDSPQSPAAPETSFAPSDARKPLSDIQEDGESKEEKEEEEEEETYMTFSDAQNAVFLQIFRRHFG